MKMVNIDTDKEAPTALHNSVLAGAMVDSAVDGIIVINEQGIVKVLNPFSNVRI